MAVSYFVVKRVHFTAFFSRTKL